MKLDQIGHVTKSGEIVGPRVLEHIIDVVLYLEVGTLLHSYFFGREVFSISNASSFKKISLDPPMRYAMTIAYYI